MSSKNFGDGYIACHGEGFNSFRLSSDKENYGYSSTLLSTLTGRAERNSKLNRGLDSIEKSPCFQFSPGPGSPQFGDEYSLFRSRSTSLSSSGGSVRSTGTVCESEISCRHRSLRSTEPPSRGLSPSDSRDAYI